MDTWSLEQSVAALCVCVFALGVLCDRVAQWFYEHYCVCETEE